MKVKVKELQEADVKTCCLHDESNNEKELMEGKYIIVYGTPEVASSRRRKDDKLSPASIHQHRLFARSFFLAS